MEDQNVCIFPVCGVFIRAYRLKVFRDFELSHWFLQLGRHWPQSPRGKIWGLDAYGDNGGYILVILQKLFLILLYNNALIYHLSIIVCLLYTSPSPRDGLLSRMPSSAWKKKVCRLLLEKKKFIFFFFFFNDPATTEIYTLHIVGSVRCV